MRYRDDVYTTSGVIDQVQDPIVTDSDAIGFLAMQLLDTEGTRVFLKSEKLVSDPLEESTVQRVEFFFGGTFKDDVIAHDERRLRRSAKY